MSAIAVRPRLPRLDAGRANVVAAIVIGVEMQAEALLMDAPPAEAATMHVLLALMALAVAVRRRRPLTAMQVGLVVFVAAQALGRDVTESLFVPLLCVFFLNFSAAVHTDGRRFVAVPVSALVAATLGVAVDEYAGSVFVDMIWGALIFAGATSAGGRLVRNRARLQAALRDKAAASARDAERRLERAALEERTRIAGELHDIVAHALSGMVVQAGAARRMVAADPAQARSAFAAVEGSGREALAELRGLLGVLRREDEELALAPQPSLAHLGALVRRTTAAGLPVRLQVEGDPVSLPAGADITAYRLVQEALRHARDHGHAGRAEVLVRYAADGVEVRVRDDGHPRPRPLLGLRERVGLYGGRLQDGADRDGWFSVRARLPLAEAA